MAVDRSHSPFETLRRKFEETDRHCGECGYGDVRGGWRVTSGDASVQYQRVCPSCDAVAVRTVDLDPNG